MPEIEFVTHVAAGADPATSLIGALVMLDPGGGAAPVLVSTTLYDGGISVWDVTGPAPGIVDGSAYSGQAGLGGVPVLAVIETVSGPALLAASGAGGALMLYPVQDDGTLGAPDNLGQTTYGADLSVSVTVALPNGNQVLYAGLAGEPGIARITFDAQGRIVSESFTSDTAASAAADIAGLAHIRAGGGDWLISACGTENAVTLWAIAANGSLAVAQTLTGAEGLWVSAPSALSAAEAHGTAYAILGSAGTDSLTVMRVGDDGTLTITDHLIDGRDTRFGGVAALEVVEMGGRLYVIAGGADDGISLYELMPNGRLLARAHIEDTTAMGLANVSAIAATAGNGRIDIFVTSAAEPGLTQLSHAPPPPGETLFATASGGSLAGGTLADILAGAQGADTLSGGGGDDVILDGGGQDVMTGGAGADVFLLSMDGAEDRITDFEQGIDRIDLSGWSMLRDISQLRITQAGTGIQIAYLDEVLIVESAAGMIDIPALTNADLIDGYRILPDYTDAFTIAPDAPEPAPEPPPEPEPPAAIPGEPPPPPLPEPGDVVGTAAADTLTADAGGSAAFGGPGNDTLHGSDGDDALYGEGGDDVLFGGAGHDLLDGGPGRDRMEGGAGNDTYHVEDPLDFLVETAGGGTDTVLAWISHTLPDHVEVLRLQGSADIHATGTQTDNILVGNAGANILTGIDGFNILNGKAGDDRLIGGPGRDWLVGDEGADVFVYGTANDSRPGQANRDLINGFENGVDLIDLSSLDANGRQSGNQAFIWIGSDPFSAAGQLRWHSWGDNNYGIVEADQDGDGVADFQIFINLTDRMSADDFIL